MRQFDPMRRRLLRAGLLATLAPRQLLAAGAAGKTDQRKYVFAHYMVCCPAAGSGATVADFKCEIHEAQTRGLDGFALNCGGWDKGGGHDYKPRAAMLYEAARQLGTGFRLFISMDYCCGNGPEETRDALETFGKHPNQFQVSGRPVLSSFGGESRDPKTGQDKIALVHGLGGFFVPYFFPQTYHEHPDSADVAQVFRDYPALDGYFYFGAVGDGDSISRSNQLLARTWLGAGKVFMADVSPFYRSFGRLNETRGFESMAREWEGAIRDGATWVEITTWNDFAEKTYVAPFGSPTDTVLWDGTNDGFGPINYSHVAYLDASRYYIDWFKSGRRPRITHDQVFYFYRTEPKTASGKQFAAAEAARGVKEIDGWQTLEDRIYVTAFLTKPATLRMHSGTSSEDFPLAAGVSHASMPFQPGTPRFQLLRNAQTLIDKWGEQAIADRQGETRYNYFAGQAASSGTGPARPDNRGKTPTTWTS